MPGTGISMFHLSVRSPAHLLAAIGLALVILAQIALPHSHAQTDPIHLKSQFAADSALVMDSIQVHLHINYIDSNSAHTYSAAALAQIPGQFTLADNVLRGYTALVAIPAAASVAIDNIAGQEYIIAGTPFRIAGATDLSQAAVLVGTPFWLRDQWVVRLQFLPVRWHQTSATMRVMDDITVRLKLTTPWPKPTHPRPDPRFETIYKNAIVNYNDGLAWRRSAPARIDIALGSAPLPGANNWRLHLRPTTSGFQRITGADLQNAGIALSNIDPRKLQLIWRNQAIPCLILGEDDGRFDADDALLFYAAPWDFKYDNNDSYWIIAGDQAGARVPTISHDPNGIVVTSFEDTVRLEEQNLYYSDLPRTDQGDHWFWESIRPSRAPTGEKKLSFDLAPMPAGPVRASLRMHAFSAGTGPIKISFWINDYLVGELEARDQTEIIFDNDFPHFILHDGANAGRLQVSKIDDANNSLILDWIELTYVRRLDAANDALTFSVNWPGPWLIQLQGFSHMPFVWDVTDPLHPLTIDARSIHTSGGDGIEFASASDQSLRYAAATTEVMVTPRIQWAPPASANLRQAQQQADYLIITPTDFLPAAQTLAAHRSQTGLSSQVVLLQDIYDQFNAGIADPNAIRAFLAYAIGTWQAPVPAYVVLLGDAHTDPRGYTTSQPEYIPPYLRNNDPWLGEVADENYLAAVIGDDPVPDIMLGRLPVRSLSGAEQLVAKIIAFENIDPNAPWTQRLLLVADNPDSAGDFYGLADAIANRFQSLLDIQRFYLDRDYESTDALRQAFLSSWSQGALFINYIGHGQPTAWAGEQIIRRQDLDQLNNAGQPSILLSMASLTGIYYWPGSQSLQEEMLLLPDQRGVVAYIASTGYGIASGNDLIDHGFLEAVLHHHVPDVGTATYLAKLHLYSQGYFYTEFLAQLYALFGDPATHLPLPAWAHTFYAPLMIRDLSGYQIQIDNPSRQ